MKNKNHTEEEILKKVEIESSQIDINDVEKIVSKENRINEKSSKLDLNRFSKLFKQIKLALSLMKDFKNKQYTQVPWRTIALISVAILYFINPFDVIPDMLPFIGITDDAFLFLSVFKSIQTDLEKYGEWKGIDTKEYF
ncbi:MAG: YkvA family protein [bacterium]